MPNDRASPDSHDDAQVDETRVKRAADSSRSVLKKAVVAKAAEVTAGAGKLLDKTRKTLIGDDPDCIEAECAYLSGILRPNPAIVPNHAIQAFAAAGIATGVLSFETPIMRFTRGHMDVGAGGFQQLWRSVFRSRMLLGPSTHSWTGYQARVRQKERSTASTTIGGPRNLGGPLRWEAVRLPEGV